MRRRRVDENNCVNEIKNTTSIIRSSLNMTLVADSILDSNSNQYPRFHAPTSLYISHGTVFIKMVKLLHKKNLFGEKNLIGSCFKKRFAVVHPVHVLLVCSVRASNNLQDFPPISSSRVDSKMKFNVK